MEFSLDESYDEDYSAVEDAIMNEAKLSQAEKNDIWNALVVVRTGLMILVEAWSISML